jgi:small GTP-binding protein
LSYPNTDSFVLFFSVTSRSSFENVSAKWLAEIRHHCPTVPIILVATKIDLRTDKSELKKLQERNETFITMEEGITNLQFSEINLSGLQKAKEIGAFKYVECSALSQKGLKETFESAIIATFDEKKNEKKNKKKNSKCIVM